MSSFYNSEVIVPLDKLNLAKVETRAISAQIDGGDADVQGIRVRIDKFGITANCITYCALGRSFQYKDFFPCTDENDPNYFTKLNVWGVATVIVSKHPGIKVGERLYGYFPAARYYDMVPNRVTPNYFNVKRPQLPADRIVYNQYMRTTHDPMYSPKTEEINIIFRPLWQTSYYLFDMMSVNKFFDASAVIITSASSKTAFCFAQLVADYVAKTNQNMKIVAVTSKPNVAFCKTLGYYTDIIEYGDVSSAIQRIPGRLVMADVAGNVNIRNQVAAAAKSRLVAGFGVGMSHLESVSATAPLDQQPTESSAPKFEMFFAPAWIQKRLKQIGAQQNLKNMTAAWQLLLRDAPKWMKFVTYSGPDAVLGAYLSVLQNAVPANEAVIGTFADGQAEKGRL